MRKREIVELIEDKAQNKFIMWLISHDIKYYDLSLVYLELYCEITGKSLAVERKKLFKGYETLNWKTKES